MTETKSNDLCEIIAQAFEQMKERDSDFSPENVNLAELSRITGLSRQRLRRLKRNGFRDVPVTRKRMNPSVLEGFTSILDNMLSKGVTNSTVCLRRLREHGYPGSQSSVKRYIASHKYLVPAPRQVVASQGSRGIRYQTGPGESYQMDWGFVKVLDYSGAVTDAACFVMVCHHCGQKYVEFFPNARQENLFIGMIHAFSCMGVPKTVLTDNMKSVVLRRDLEGHPVWQKDYESFMRTVGFSTRLCKPRHPFTKGKVERLVRFVKDNFMPGRTFWNYTDLNEAVSVWCRDLNSCYQKYLDDIPERVHLTRCMVTALPLVESEPLLFYLCPERKISFDGFINYEGRRFGVPFRHTGRTVRVCRDCNVIRIYTPDLKELLVTHDVTWSRRDRFCVDQFDERPQPEELPTAPVRSEIRMVPKEPIGLGFDKFDFEREEDNE